MRFPARNRGTAMNQGWGFRVKQARKYRHVPLVEAMNF